MSKKLKILLSVCCAVLAAVAVFLVCILGGGGGYYLEDGSFQRITRRSSVRYSMQHPAFEGIGEFIMPWLDGFNRNISVLYNWDFMALTAGYNGEDIVSGLNFLIEQKELQGELVYPYYSEAEILADESKRNAQVLFIPGEKDKPVAFVVPGGGFNAWCAIAEGFPVARDLHEKGYNVFVIQYRISIEDSEEAGERMALADMSRAVKYVHDNAQSFGVDMRNYSVWGFSAGGRLCHLFCADQEFGYGAIGLPSPRLATLVYSGWYDEKLNDASAMPSVYFSYTKNDSIIGEENVKAIEKTIEFLKSQNKSVGVAVFEKADHGYGVGKGTEADGWLNGACDFWESLDH